MTHNQEDRSAALEANVQELDALVSLALRLLSIEKSISALLNRYGATETEDLAVHALLDDMVQRAEQGGILRGLLPRVVGKLCVRFPRVRGNQEFLSLLLDMWKVDRPTYQQLHAFISTQRGTQWT
jgi:hypothetical protein